MLVTWIELAQTASFCTSEHLPRKSAEESRRPSALLIDRWDRRFQRLVPKAPDNCHYRFYEKVVKVKADVVAILNFSLPPSHAAYRFAWATDRCGQTGDGARGVSAERFETPLGGGGSQRRLPRRGGNPPAPAFLLGETGKGDRIPCCRRPFCLRCTCVPISRLYAYWCFLENSGCVAGRRSVSGKSSVLHPLMPRFYPHSE